MPLLNSEETAAQIGVSISWLNHSRQIGTGPKYLKLGHAVRYRPEDVTAWLEKQARTRVWNFDEEAA
jgi:predicted DNA-binding transcriptional regulator AlpA